MKRSIDLDQKAEVPFDCVFPHTVKVVMEIDWPAAHTHEGSRYYQTSKVGISRLNGQPSAEYEDAEARRIWINADGSVVED